MFLVLNNLHGRDIRWQSIYHKTFTLFYLLAFHHGLIIWNLQWQKQCVQSLNCDELDCKGSHGMRKRSSFVLSIMSNPRSLSASQNSSFCMRGNVNQNAHARRIAQILLSPTGSSLPSNTCSSCPTRESPPTMVCDFVLSSFLFWLFLLVTFVFY